MGKFETYLSTHAIYTHPYKVLNTSLLPDQNEFMYHIHKFVYGFTNGFTSEISLCAKESLFGKGKNGKSLIMYEEMQSDFDETVGACPYFSSFDFTELEDWACRFIDRLFVFYKKWDIIAEKRINEKSKKYLVDVYWEMLKTVEVEADTEAEATRKTYQSIKDGDIQPNGTVGTGGIEVSIVGMVDENGEAQYY